MLRNHVKDRLLKGETSVGAWVGLPSPEAAGYVGALPLDWAVVDTEHFAIDLQVLGQMFAAYRAGGVAPLVRVPWNTPENVKRVLDVGAWGVVIPMISTKAEAEAAVASVRYPPLGVRSLGGLRHAVSFGATATDYFANANDHILLVAQIEHIDGVNNIEEILSVPGIDVCHIGPRDLSASMGHALKSFETDLPDVVEAIEHVRNAAQSRGIPLGIHASGPAGVKKRAEEGFQFIPVYNDIAYMVQGMQKDLDAIDWTPSERGLTVAS